MSHPLRNAAGVIVGVCDEGIPLFDREGRRPWGPWSEKRARALDAEAHSPATDVAPKMQDFIRGYKRLP
jgi:hypothetical protein